jgi:hypothetical protein
MAAHSQAAAKFNLGASTTKLDAIPNVQEDLRHLLLRKKIKIEAKAKREHGKLCPLPDNPPPNNMLEADEDAGIGQKRSTKK